VGVGYLFKGMETPIYYNTYVGDVIGSNFKVLDKIISTIKEGRAVGASSSYG